MDTRITIAVALGVVGVLLPIIAAVNVRRDRVRAAVFPAMDIEEPIDLHLVASSDVRAVPAGVVT